MESGKTIEIESEEVKKLFGKEIEDGGSNIEVKITAKSKETTSIQQRRKKYEIIITAITSGAEEVINSEDDSPDNENGSESENASNDNQETSESNSSSSNDKEDDVDWWEDKWDDLTNIVGHIKVKLIDIVLMPFDALQSAVNSIQTGSFSKNDKLTSWDIVMEPQDITADPNKNQYVEYTEKTENLGVDGQKIEFINARNDGLEDITKLPVIPVEFYTMAKGQIELFDVNFLSGQDNTKLHPSTSKWLVLRNFVSVVMHIIIYLGASALLIKLIINGIVIVSKTLTPIERSKIKIETNDFIKATVMLIASVVIMGLCIFLSNSMFNSINTSRANELPIRVNVGKGNEDGKDNKYSFSTNIIGYFRFMAQANRPRTSDLKALYAVIYIVLVLINAIAALVMLGRVWILAFLSIIGPIIAISTAFNKETVLGMTYQGWAINYLLASGIQLVLAIIYNIVLQIAF